MCACVCVVVVVVVLSLGLRRGSICVSGRSLFKETQVVLTKKTKKKTKRELDSFGYSSPCVLQCNFSLSPSSEWS